MEYRYLVFVVAGLSLAGFLTDTQATPTETCQPRNESYSISDSEQCDIYYVCPKSGKMTQHMCDDGFVFSESIRLCEYPHNVDCAKRPKLQPAQSKGDPHCERLNGFYPFPPKDSCSKFYHCLEGKAYEKTCPEGVIFDPKKGSCVHPDMASRPDCAAHTVLNFKCPNMNQRFSRLRFGDHDRFAHPTDCRKFFICLADGQPRIGGCPFGKVFHQKTGFCDTPKKVPECKDYYEKKAKSLEDSGEEDDDQDDSIESSEGEQHEKMKQGASSTDKQNKADSRHQQQSQKPKEKDPNEANSLKKESVEQQQQQQEQKPDQPNKKKERQSL